MSRNKMNIRELYELRAPVLTPSKRFSACSFGIEIELENVLDFGRSWFLGGFTPKEDGSLRNNGVEFISLPETYDTLVDQLKKFYQRNKITKNNLSERCSVHIHLNVQNLFSEQLITFIQLYQVLEKLLFTWTGDQRDEGIFCVPLSETQLINQIFTSRSVDAMVKTISSWQKYTALNLLPVRRLGTVEFRHLGPREDVTDIINWITLIARMYEFVLSINKINEFIKRVISLNTISDYDKFIYDIFKEEAVLFAHIPLNELLEEGVLHFKGMIYKNKIEKAKPNSKIMYEFNEVFNPVPEEGVALEDFQVIEGA